MKAPIPYVQRFRDRHGKLRYYYRRGKTRAALPDPADGWGAFLDAYRAAERGSQSKPPDSGTMGALITAYLASAEFKALKPNSQTTYRYALDFLRSRDGVKVKAADVRRPHILALRDEIAETAPGKANMVLKVLGVLFQFAIDREWVTANPALRIKPVKGGEYRSWTDAELLQFEARWPRGTTERLAYELALYTGQRRGDLAKMTWGDIRDGKVHVTQEKTGEKVWIPLAPSLALELGQRPRRHSVVLAGPSGRGYTARHLGTVFAAAIDAAGLPTECVLHGLRKAATRRLAEAGASDAEIMSVTGHRSRGMVTLYTRDADRQRMAENAMARLDPEQDLSNRVKPQRKR